MKFQQRYFFVVVNNLMLFVKLSLVSLFLIKSMSNS